VPVKLVITATVRDAAGAEAEASVTVDVLSPQQPAAPEPDRM